MGNSRLRGHVFQHTLLWRVLIDWTHLNQVNSHELCLKIMNTAAPKAWSYYPSSNVTYILGM